MFNRDGTRSHVDCQQEEKKLSFEAAAIPEDSWRRDITGSTSRRKKRREVTG